MIATEVSPVTYPARPMRGGSIKPGFKQLPGVWAYEPKLNGWRTLVHMPTGAMFNRHLEPLTIADEFQPVLDALTRTHGVPEWLDCEALERRHGLGRGTLVVLDMVAPGLTYTQRHARLMSLLPILEWTKQPEHDSVYVTDSIIPNKGGEPWLFEQLQKKNKEWGCQFYEGLVAKQLNSLYPMQLNHPEQPFPGWLKHRWQWS